MDKVSKIKAPKINFLTERLRMLVLIQRCAALILFLFASFISAQTQPAAPADQKPPEPTRANVLRGEYGRYRANNDLLFYHLDVRVDPEKKFLSGKVTTRFKMLKDDTRIQLDRSEERR